MGLGSTARKLQGLTDTAEELYSKLSEVLERVRDIEESIETTNTRVTEMNDRLDRQDAVLDAVADELGIDVEAIEADLDALAEADEDAEPIETTE